MWLPERKALAAANGGKRVALMDFPKFALCGRHGHLLRKEGVRVYRYADEVKRERESEESREAEAKSWGTFAERFVVKAKSQGNGPKGKRLDFSATGMGLSRCAKMDADKRPSKAPRDEKLTSNGVAAVSAAAPSP
jgi:hypothetical protein